MNFPLNTGIIIKNIKKMLNSSSTKRYTALDKVSRKWNGDPFKVLVSTILSQRTKDEHTTKAAEQLFSVFSTPQEIIEGNINKIQELIKPAGFYKVKSNALKKVSKIIQEKYFGKVPKKLDDLLQLPYVGQKTANCVRVYAFNIPAIPVDTHVHRISNRLRLVKTKTPNETEKELVKIISVKYWLSINDLFVRFGQTICKPIKPKCSICNLKNMCFYYKTHKNN